MRPFNSMISLPIAILFFALQTSFSCSTRKAHAISHKYTSQCLKDKIFTALTVDELNRSPGTYDGKLIQVTGVYQRGFEKSLLSASLRSSDQSSLWVRFSEQCPLISSRDSISLFDVYSELDQLNSKKIIVKGQFEYDRKKLDPYLGILKNVSEIIVLRSNER